MAAGRGSVLMSELAADLPADHGGLLVVDDEPFLRDAVAASLRFLGFDVTTADNGAEALRLARDSRFDLLVLDVMLPDVDGFDVVRRLRRDGSWVPVIFLTARDTQADKVTGLTIGGDDYLTKPFGLEELAARIRSVLRRTRPDRAGGPVLTFADIELDQDSYEVRRSGQVIELSPTEFRLLRYLMLNPGRVLTRAQLLDHVWDYDFGGSSTVVATYIAYLRRKLAAYGPDVIHTQRGVGYSAAIAARARRHGGPAMRPGLLRRPRRAMLRTRVLIGVLLVTLVALAAFDVAAVTALRTYLIGQTDSQLQNLIGLYRLASSITPSPPFAGRWAQPPATSHPAGELDLYAAEREISRHGNQQLRAPFLQPFSVELVTGKLRRRGCRPASRSRASSSAAEDLAPRLLPPKNLRRLAARGQAWTTTSLRGNEPLRLLARRAPGGSVIVAYTSLDGVNKTVGQLELILVIGSAAAGLLAAGGVAWIMRRGLRPIETMAGQADAITAGDLTEPRRPAGHRGPRSAASAWR